MTQTSPTVSWHKPQYTQRTWGVEALVSETPAYTGKVLYRYDDSSHHRAGLQYHPDRAESAYLMSGQAIFYWVDDLGVLRKRLLKPGVSVTIPQGVVHSFQTIGHSVVFETSTPGRAPAVNVEKDYDIAAAVES